MIGKWFGRVRAKPKRELGRLGVALVVVSVLTVTVASGETSNSEQDPTLLPTNEPTPSLTSLSTLLIPSPQVSSASSLALSITPSKTPSLTLIIMMESSSEDGASPSTAPTLSMMTSVSAPEPSSVRASSDQLTSTSLLVQLPSLSDTPSPSPSLTTPSMSLSSPITTSPDLTITSPDLTITSSDLSSTLSMVISPSITPPMVSPSRTSGTQTDSSIASMNVSATDPSTSSTLSMVISPSITPPMVSPSRTSETQTDSSIASMNVSATDPSTSSTLSMVISPSITPPMVSPSRTSGTQTDSSTASINVSTTPTPIRQLAHIEWLSIICSSGGAVIIILLIVLVGVLLCCCYVTYRRFSKKRRYIHQMQRTNSFFESTVDRSTVPGVSFGQSKALSNTELSQVELARLQMNFDQITQSTARDSHYMSNGSLSNHEVHSSRIRSSSSNPYSTFYPSMKETRLQAPATGLIIPNKNAPIFGPTEDYNEEARMETSLTQDSISSRIADLQLPKKAEFIHDDIKVDKPKEVEKDAHSNEVEEEKPLSKSPPAAATVTTLSKKEASMVDLSMITMIRNNHFEEEASSPVNKAPVSTQTLGRRRHTSTEVSSDLELVRSFDSDTQKRRGMKALDLGALTSITSPTRRTSDEASLEQSSGDKGKKVKKKDSLSRRQSRSMANLSYGGEADDEEEDRPSKQPSNPKRPTSSNTPLFRASSMLEELTSIGKPSKPTIEPLKEMSQEASQQDKFLDTSGSVSKQKEPQKLKSILKNSGSRSQSTINLYYEPSAYDGHNPGGYSPSSMPRHVYPSGTQLEDATRVVPARRRTGSAYGDINPLRRAPSYDIQQVSYQYPTMNGHHKQPPMKEMDVSEQFWGRSVHNYYESDISSPDYLSAKQTGKFGAY